MMAQDDTALDAQALDWIVRTGDPAFDDWPGFMAWMEADPTHATRYHALSAAIDDGVASLRAPQAGWWRRRWPARHDARRSG
ncbi:hypothetical protein QP185_16050 [Sphingomonas aerolata]|uniref:DUF4880 domain-containing protein n=1 Tax=Sphingomonas aerolata TaxID=185951 RepID=UPI002FE3806D